MGLNYIILIISWDVLQEAHLLFTSYTFCQSITQVNDESN